MAEPNQRKPWPWWLWVIWLVPLPAFLIPPWYAVVGGIFVGLGALGYLMWRSTQRDDAARK